VASAGVRPGGPVHVVVANELLDNLPFDLAQRHAAGWDEVRLVEDPDHTWTEVLVPLDGARAALLDRLVPGAVPGARAPLQGPAGEWVAAGLGQLAPGGRLVVLDYGATTAELAARPWTRWVRTYRGHDHGGAPWSDPGRQDVTVEVAWDQVGATSRPPDRLRPQVEALRAWGIDALVEEGRRLWRERTGPADRTALRARSRVGESEALMDPTGLGGFTVAERSVGP
jgi:SAM-dependent MidA family methyltransferase